MTNLELLLASIENAISEARLTGDYEGAINAIDELVKDRQAKLKQETGT